MPRGRPPGIRDLLWWTAYVAFGLAAIAAPGREQTLTGICVAITVCWTIESARVVRSSNERPTRAESRLLSGLVSVALLIELVGMFVAWSFDRPTLATMYVAASVFALLAILTTQLRAPTDLALIALLAYHGYVAVSALTVILPSGLRSHDDATRMIAVFYPILLTALPLVLICAVIAAFAEHAQGHTREHRLWMILLWGAICWIMVMVRCFSA